MLVLSSCSLVDIRLKMLNAVDEEAIANTRLEEVIEALENQDKEALKANVIKLRQSIKSLTHENS
jgi:hypothetical protein